MAPARKILCDVDGFDRDKVRLCVAERRSSPPRPWQITLLQAVPKGKLIESIVQKATELGVARIIPIVSERVVVKVEAKPEKQENGRRSRSRPSNNAALPGFLRSSAR